jgi:hypothetical protein
MGNTCCASGQEMKPISVKDIKDLTFNDLQSNQIEFSPIHTLPNVGHKIGSCNKNLHLLVGGKDQSVIKFDPWHN